MKKKIKGCSLDMAQAPEIKKHFLAIPKENLIVMDLTTEIKNKLRRE